MISYHESGRINLCLIGEVREKLNEYQRKTTTLYFTIRTGFESFILTLQNPPNVEPLWSEIVYNHSMLSLDIHLPFHTIWHPAYRLLTFLASGATNGLIMDTWLPQSFNTILTLHSRTCSQRVFSLISQCCNCKCYFTSLSYQRGTTVSGPYLTSNIIYMPC